MRRADQQRIKKSNLDNYYYDCDIKRIYCGVAETGMNAVHLGCLVSATGGVKPEGVGVRVWKMLLSMYSVEELSLFKQLRKEELYCDIKRIQRQIEALEENEL